MRVESSSLFCSTMTFPPLNRAAFFVAFFRGDFHLKQDFLSSIRPAGNESKTLKSPFSITFTDFEGDLTLRLLSQLYAGTSKIPQHTLMGIIYTLQVDILCPIKDSTEKICKIFYSSAVCNILNFDIRSGFGCIAALCRDKQNRQK